MKIPVTHGAYFFGLCWIAHSVVKFPEDRNGNRQIIRKAIYDVPKSKRREVARLLARKIAEEKRWK